MDRERYRALDDGYLPAGVPGGPLADRECLRRQLHDRGQGAEALPAHRYPMHEWRPREDAWSGESRDGRPKERLKPPLETGLRGRRALVTAASKGLGYASARALVA